MLMAVWSNDRTVASRACALGASTASATTTAPRNDTSSPHLSPASLGTPKFPNSTLAFLNVQDRPAPLSDIVDGPLPSGRHSLTRDAVLASQRGRLLDAMAEAVAEHSYGATTIAHVVSHAGVSRKTFYEHFRDKEHCFLAMYDTGIAFVRRPARRRRSRRRPIRATGWSRGCARSSPCWPTSRPSAARSCSRSTRSARSAWPSGAPCCRCSRAATSRSTARRASRTRRSSRWRATSRSASWARYWSSWPAAWRRAARPSCPSSPTPLSDFVVRNVLARPVTLAEPRACRPPPPGSRFPPSRTSTSSCARRSAASSPNELRPHVGEWEDAEWFPNEVFTRMAELGYLGLKYPEEYGGQGGDYVHDAVLAEELTGAGSGGLSAGIGAHIGIATPPIWKFGTEDQKQRFLAPAIRGERIAALGITEPGAGSDVAGIRTFARKVDGGYVVNGSKTFITNGVRADFVVTAVKTTEDGGHQGLSFLLLEKEMEGYSVSQEAREARLARLRHRRARLRRRVRPRREPARRGEQGLLPDHGQLPVGAAGDGAGGGRLDGADGRAHASPTRASGPRSASRSASTRRSATRSPRWPSSTRRRGRSPTTRCDCSRPARTRSAR